jgi:hypothetical protein
MYFLSGGLFKQINLTSGRDQIEIGNLRHSVICWWNMIPYITSPVGDDGFGKIPFDLGDGSRINDGGMLNLHVNQIRLYPPGSIVKVFPDSSRVLSFHI